MSLDAPTSSPVFVTKHAGDRWDLRTEPDSVAPETAWQHSQRIDAGAPFQACDEIRYHRPTRTLLLFRGMALTTVYDVDDLEPRYYHAVKHALENHE